MGRVLEPADFPPIPLNDDEEVDSVRLRVRKGSGRATFALYEMATRAVADLGADLQDAAENLDLDLALLRIWVEGRRAAQAAGCEGVDQTGRQRAADTETPAHGHR